MLVSALKLASDSVSFPFVALGLSFEGMGARSLSGAGVFPVVVSAGAFLRGLATVSLLGLSCAQTPTIRVSAAAAPSIHFFIGTLF